jgi:hypothetical protein
MLDMGFSASDFFEIQNLVSSYTITTDNIELAQLNPY